MFGDAFGACALAQLCDARVGGSASASGSFGVKRERRAVWKWSAPIGATRQGNNGAGEGERGVLLTAAWARCARPGLE